MKASEALELTNKVRVKERIVRSPLLEQVIDNIYRYIKKAAMEGVRGVYIENIDKIAIVKYGLIEELQDNGYIIEIESNQRGEISSITIKW